MENKLKCNGMFMNAVYVKENNELKYFIMGINSEINDDEYNINDIDTVNKFSFRYPWNVKRIFFDGALKKIETESFKGADELEVFCCGKFSKGQNTVIENLNINESIKGVRDKNESDEFIVQSYAFSGCENLHTVIFPISRKLIIEKSSFENCSSLRTVVIFAKEISITGNPFENSPEELTFICYKDSEVERFARENGYRYVNVKRKKSRKSN